MVFRQYLFAYFCLYKNLTNTLFLSTMYNMIKKVKDFFKTNKHAVIWTLYYALAVWLTLLLLFGFNLFSGADWSILMRAQLRGFAGFAFGLLILATIPLYVATTSIIIRTKKPLFNLPFVKKKEEKKPEAAPIEKKEEELPAPLPAGIPTELRGAFLRARQHTGLRPKSAFEMKDYADTEKEKTIENTQTESAMPLPDNFDFAGDEEDTSSAPVFRDINFDEPSTPTFAPIPEFTSEKTSALHKHLESKNIKYSVHDDVTIVNDIAIVTHDDEDFWIADDDSWFAAGKQKESPITIALAAAEHHNVTPALYLATENIMDLDNKIETWKSSGIKVIKNLDDIKK